MGNKIEFIQDKHHEYLVIDIGNELLRRGGVVNGATLDYLEKLTIKELKDKLSKLMK